MGGDITSHVHREILPGQGPGPSLCEGAPAEGAANRGAEGRRIVAAPMFVGPTAASSMCLSGTIRGPPEAPAVTRQHPQNISH